VKKPFCCKHKAWPVAMATEAAIAGKLLFFFNRLGR